MKKQFYFLFLLAFLSENLFSKTLPTLNIEKSIKDADNFERGLQEADDYGYQSSEGSEDDAIEASSDSDSETTGTTKTLRKFKLRLPTLTEEEKAAKKRAFFETRKALEDLYFQVKSTLKKSDKRLYELFTKWRRKSSREMCLHSLVGTHLKEREFAKAKDLLEKLRNTKSQAHELSLLRSCYDALRGLHRYIQTFRDRSIVWEEAVKAAFNGTLSDFILVLAKKHKTLRNIKRAEALYNCLSNCYRAPWEMDSYIADMYGQTWNHVASTSHKPSSSIVALFKKTQRRFSRVNDDPGNHIVQAASQFPSMERELLNWFLDHNYYGHDPLFSPDKVSKLFKDFSPLLDKLFASSTYANPRYRDDLERTLRREGFVLIVSEKTFNGYYGSHRKYMYFWIHRRKPIQVRIKDDGEVTAGIVRVHPLLERKDRTGRITYSLRQKSSGAYVFLNPSNEVLKWSKAGVFIPSRHDLLRWKPYVSSMNRTQVMNDAHHPLSRSDSDLSSYHAQSLYTFWVSS